MQPADGYLLFNTALGWCGLAWRGSAIAGAILPGADRDASLRRLTSSFPASAEAAGPYWVRGIVARVAGLLDGAPDSLLDVPLDMANVPPFHQRVYEVTRAIEPGRTLTYGQVATAVGDPGAARAVGQALGANPFAPIVPCHRILASGNRGGGFSAPGGVDTKLRMLLIEQARFGNEPGLFD